MHTLAILLMFVLAHPLQRIETQYPDRARVMRVETAMNHLTVIELAEPVTLAAAGSPSFKIERRDNKVFIQPLDEGAATNLFVWTSSGRWNYELVPAASVETMHFAIDPRIPAPQSQNSGTPDSAASGSTLSKSFAEEMLLFARPIRNLGVQFVPTEVAVFITDVYRKDGQLFLRYVIDNSAARPYLSGVPEVFALDVADSETAIHAVRYSQVGRDIERKIRSRGQARLATIDCEVPSGPLAPGEMAAGILTVSLDETTPTRPRVLRIVFPTHGGAPISLTLVL